MQPPALAERSIVKLSNWVSHKQKGKRISLQEQTLKITSDELLDFMKKYAESERTSGMGRLLAGQIYWLYDRAELPVQHEFIEKLCKAHGVDVPSLDWRPRQRLILAVFGTHPELVAAGAGISQGNTLAAMRIREAIRAYELKAGLRKVRKVRITETVPRKTKDFVVPLMAAATEAEKKILSRLIARVYGKKAVKAVSTMQVTRVRGKYRKIHRTAA
jgi:hypothetical protein